MLHYGSIVPIFDFRQLWANLEHLTASWSFRLVVDKHGCFGSSYFQDLNTNSFVKPGK